MTVRDSYGNGTFLSRIGIPIDPSLSVCQVVADLLLWETMRSKAKEDDWLFCARMP